MKYIAHKTEDGRQQSVKEHLCGVAEKCRLNAIDELKEYAYLCGLLHDAGKIINPDFQKRINGSPIHTEHARHGAQLLHKQPITMYRPMLEYCIAGHHSGLPDGGMANDMPDFPTLHGILKREIGDCSEFFREIDVKYPKDNFGEIFSGISNKEEIIELYAFFTRYMYSCLTDADFIDTEEFCSPDAERGIRGDFKKAYELICKKMDGFKPETELQKSRGKIQEQVYKKVDGNSDIYVMDMPTGSGKTLCSMKAALKLAVEKQKKRIIYVIPFVSVIEQTAGVFEEIFGDVLPVLQHHSNYDFSNEDAENDMTAEKLRRTCENWDAGLIVTTNVQFFESMYHCRSSRLRKLHNMADSVIVFDEVHMLPAQYIKPCLRAIGYVTKYLHSAALMMSATMPDYSEYMNGGTVTEVIEDKSLFSVFRKCSYQYIGRCTLEGIAERTAEEKSALVIVNTKKEALELYKLCKFSYDGAVFHLSANIIPADRSCIMEEIKNSLKNGIRTLVISTSLIEAGVDMDFETVYRENAGIDNILQAGGRCNREGKRADGNVYVFETDGGYGDIQIKSDITRKLFEEFDDISEEKCIREYYKRLFNDNADIINKSTIASYMGESIKFDSIPFRTYAENFNFIDNETIGIVVPTEENAELIAVLEYGKLSVKRRLQKYSASVKYYELEKMIKLGIVRELSGIWILSNTDYYSKETGLNIDAEQNYLI